MPIVSYCRYIGTASLIVSYLLVNSKRSTARRGFTLRNGTAGDLDVRWELSSTYEIFETAKEQMPSTSYARTTPAIMSNTTPGARESLPPRPPQPPSLLPPSEPALFQPPLQLSAEADAVENIVGEEMKQGTVAARPVPAVGYGSAGPFAVIPPRATVPAHGEYLFDVNFSPTVLGATR